MSLNNRKAAKTLLETECFRSSASRSYYAAYCAVTEMLAKKYILAHDGNNPSHADLPNLILYNLADLPTQTRQEIRKAARRLWKARVDADYAPDSTFDKSAALDAFRDAHRVLQALEIEDE